MKKNYKYLSIDFLKNLRDNTPDDVLRRSYGTVIEKMLSNVNILEYLIYEKEYYRK